MTVKDTLAGRTAEMTRAEFERLEDIVRTHEGSLSVYDDLRRAFPDLDQTIPTNILIKGEKTEVKETGSLFD